MKITFVISSLSSGGAEKVLTIMANSWSAAGHDITVVTFSSPENDFFPLGKNIQRISLNCLSDSKNIFQAAYSNIIRLAKLHHTLHKLQSRVTISFIDKTNIMVLLASTCTNQKIIVTEHTDPARQSIGKGWSLLRRLVYPFSAAVIVLSDQIKDWTIQAVDDKSVFLPKIKEKLWVMPNPIDFEAIQAESREKLPEEIIEIIKKKKTVFTQIARLSSEKDPSLLIEACHILQESYKDFAVFFIGQGPLFKDIQKQIIEKKLENTIFLLGEKTNPYPYMAAARSVLLTSSIEGFGMVLAEAILCGAVPVSTDGIGPRNILVNGQFGLLVPAHEPHQFAKAMFRIATDDELYHQLKKGAAESIQRFNKTLILEDWERLINKVLTGKN